MAIIDDLVASGLSPTQAQAVVDVDSGTGSQEALVAQGLFVGQASTVTAASPSADDLISAGFSEPQELGIVAALAVTP